MSEFEQLRHHPPSPLDHPREIVVVCAPLRSNVNLSRITRTVTCCGITRMIACGNPKLDPEITRDGLDRLDFQVRRSLPPVLDRLHDENYQLVGLEQTTHSVSLHDHRFARRTALVIGNERTGLEPDALAKLDAVVEIPVWGLPYAYNVATAAAMALYEYCRQWPRG